MNIFLKKPESMGYHWTQLQEYEWELLLDKFEESNKCLRTWFSLVWCSNMSMHVKLPSVLAANKLLNFIIVKLISTFTF